MQRLRKNQKKGKAKPVYGSTVKVGENIAMDKNNLGNEGQNNSIPDKERKDGNKKKTESFEIIIRGSEIYRINARTKEVVQVFQCVDHCLRGNKTDELYSGDFKFMGHEFSITGKEGAGHQYIINIFGDVMFRIIIDNVTGMHMENNVISAEYEECLDEYTASFMMEMGNVGIRIWIEIN